MNVLSKPVFDAHDDAEEEGQTSILNKEGSIGIQSKMPGTFWTRPSPSASPFVVIGDRVQEGQTVALVEVMKTFTAITSQSAGIFQGWEKADGASISSSDVLGWIENET